MKDILGKNKLVLAEAAVVERIRRMDGVDLDDILVHAGLIYNDGKEALATIYQEYIDISLEYNYPLLLSSPTWRANKERVLSSGVSTTINRDNVSFLRRVIGEKNAHASVKLGGLIGCKNDCYLPNEGLSVNEALEFHRWQIEELAQSGADFLIAVTLPSVREAKGIALAMERVCLPYIISFVIGADGKVLDGTDLNTAFSEIDDATKVPPIGYFVNCSYPTFLNIEAQDDLVVNRLLGIQANASALDHCELDGSLELKNEPLSEWGNLMLDLNRLHNVKVLGGCCGTDGEYLKYLARSMS